MLVSKKNRFIFIHIYKTAGTSIKAALLPFAAPQWQIITASLLKKARLPVPNKIDYSPLAKHANASKVIDELGKENYKSYFSFAFVRNPWDWQVSLYKYMLKDKNHKQHHFIKEMSGFDEYIRWRCENEVRYQKDFLYDDNNELLVDYVGRYERLNHDFKEICTKIGVSASLPVKNVSNTLPYRDFYNEETIKLVEKAFKPDIIRFNYSF